MQNVNVYNNVGVGMGYDDSKLSTFHMKKKKKENFSKGSHGGGTGLLL